MRKCVEHNTNKLLEASGNMTVDRIKSVSETGVDFISVGALTHSYTALDISLKFSKWGASMKLSELTQKIKDSLQESLTELGYFDENIDIVLETPKTKTNGDFSSNVAMRYAKIARKAPFIIAEDIKNTLKTEGLFIEKIEVAKPGFINFFLDKSFSG